MKEANAHTSLTLENRHRLHRNSASSRNRSTTLEKDRDVFVIEHVGDAENTPQGPVAEAIITVGVIIATHQILRWTTSQTVLPREQHVTHAGN